MMLRTHLAMGIGGIVALMLVPVGLSLLSLRELRKDTERIRDQGIPGRRRARQGPGGRAGARPGQGLPLSILPEEATLTQFDQKPHRGPLLVDSLDQVNGIAGISRVRGALRAIADGRITHTNWLLRDAPPADSVIDKAIGPPIDDIERIVALSEQANQDRTRERVNDIAIESVRSPRLVRRMVQSLDAMSRVRRIRDGRPVVLRASGYLPQAGVGAEPREGDRRQHQRRRPRRSARRACLSALRFTVE